VGSCVWRETGFAKKRVAYGIKVGLLSVAASRLLCFQLPSGCVEYDRSITGRLKKAIRQQRRWLVDRCFYSWRARTHTHTSDPTRHPIIARLATLRPFSGHPGLSLLLLMLRGWVWRGPCSHPHQPSSTMAGAIDPKRLVAAVKAECSEWLRRGFNVALLLQL